MPVNFKFLFLKDFTLPAKSGIFYVFDLLYIVIIINLIIGFISLIHILTNDFKDNSIRLFWLIGILFTGGFAAWFYWFQRKKILSENQNLSD